MKRILIGIILSMLAMSVQASQWAEHKASVVARENEKGNVSSNSSSSTAKQNANPTTLQTQNVTVLPKILRGEPLKVNIEASWKMGERGCATTKQRVQNAYNAWFQNAANTIKAQHREQEFKDVLPTLQKGVAMEFNCVTAGAKPAPADVTVSFKMSLEEIHKEYGDSSVAGFCRFGRGKEPIKVVVPGFSGELNEQARDNVLVHELGHTLGLADAYLTGYKRNASDTHRSKQREHYSVMNVFSLRPDDADGLINIMDSWNIHHAKQKYGSSWKKHISPRVTKGWDGLHRHEKTGSAMNHYREGTSTAVQAQHKARDISAKANSKVF